MSNKDVPFYNIYCACSGVKQPDIDYCTLCRPDLYENDEEEENPYDHEPTIFLKEREENYDDLYDDYEAYREDDLPDPEFHEYEIQFLRGSYKVSSERVFAIDEAHAISLVSVQYRNWTANKDYITTIQRI